MYIKDNKISELDLSNPLTGAEVFVFVQNNTTKQNTLAFIQAFLMSSFPAVETSQGGITAYATGGQLNATQLTKNNNWIDVCTTDLGSVKCYAALSNGWIYIQNVSAKKINVYPKLGERFHVGLILQAINAPIMIPSRTALMLYCADGENGIFRTK